MIWAELGLPIAAWENWSLSGLRTEVGIGTEPRSQKPGRVRKDLSTWAPITSGNEIPSKRQMSRSASGRTQLVLSIVFAYILGVVPQENGKYETEKKLRR